MPDTSPETNQPEHHRQALHRATDTITRVWPHAQLDQDAYGWPAGKPYDGPGGGQAFLIDGEAIPLTSVERAAFIGSYSVAWIAELHDTCLRVFHAAWPMFAPALEWTPETIGPLLHQAVDIIADRLANHTLPWPEFLDLDRSSPNYGHDRYGLYRLADGGQRQWPPPAKKGDTVGGVTVGQRSNQVELCKLCEEPVTGGRNDPIRRIDGDAYHGKSCWFTVTRQRQAKDQAS